MQTTVKSLLENLKLENINVLPKPSWKGVLITFAGALGAAALWEQVSFQRRRRGIPGPRFTIPFFGAIGEIIKNPFEYYEKQRSYGDLSWSSALGQLIIFTRDPELTREVFANPESFNLWLTKGAKRILGDNNIAFMTGEPHKELRKRILPLFTPRALSIFLKVQEQCIRKHLKELFDSSHQGVSENDLGTEFETRPFVRDMNVDTSTTVFVGPYVDDALRKTIADEFWSMNAGFLSFPLPLPGTQLWNAIKSRERLVEIFVGCLHKARDRMKNGIQPECLLDVWVEEEMKITTGHKTEDRDVAFHVMDFLFASQDASTSSIVWVIALLDQHPEVYQKVLEEQLRIRPFGKDEIPISAELVNQMTYTKQVIREILRFRPPATMVPHIAIKDTKIKNYDIKKGTVILPSIWAAHIDGYPEPEKFDPERFHPDRERDATAQKNFLAFGYGPHRCIGIQYALNHLILFTSELTRYYEWKRTKTEGGDEIIFLPTIFPKDGARIRMKKRQNV
jgi:cytochrome P450 family 710 subfamily A protein